MRSSALPRAGAVVLSDYAKGVLTPRVIRAVIDAANKRRQAGDRRSQGPRLQHLSRRHPDHAEPQGTGGSHAQPAPRPTTRSPPPRRNLRDALDAEAVLVTRSEDGMTLVGEGAPIHVPAYPVRVRDVSGAGDTVVAVLAAMLAMRRRFRVRDARGQCRRRGGGRQARHGDGVGRRTALAHPAGRVARAGRKDRVRLERCSTSISPNGASRACASASPMAASTSCIPATSSCWPRRARPATGWWSGLTATPRSRG